MKRKIEALIALFALCLALLPACGREAGHGAEEEVGYMEETGEFRLSAFSYPAGAAAVLADGEDKAFAARAAGGGWQGMSHREGTSLAVSPYFTLSGETGEIPVYATPVYIGETGRGALHSFASADAEFGPRREFALTLIPSGGFETGEMRLFAPEDGGDAEAGDGAITLRLRKYGVYTLLFGTDQEHAFTLFVRPFSDEEKEIAALRAELGEENVRVLEPGIHTDAHLSFDRDGSVLYMKAGAILLPEHTLDILSDKDAAEKSEEGALGENALGLNRYPVINACGKKDVRILGRGTVDMTGLDWHERRGVVFSLCDGAEISDLILINPGEWATIFYRSENVTVRRCAVFGWKTNSDAFAVCNSRNVRVTDSFARSGDDLFEVKTLGGPENAAARNVTFARCQAWGGKARCFGVTGEIEREIDGVLFEDSAVLFRDATWDNDRIGSLVVIRETGTGEVKNVIFRNIEVWYDAGRAINCAVYSPEIAGSRISAVFEEIVCRAGEKSRCEGRTGGGNAMEIVFRKVTVNGERITKENLGEKVLLDDPAIARAE